MSNSSHPIRLVNLKPEDVDIDVSVGTDAPSDEEVLNVLVANKGLIVRAAAQLNISEEYIVSVVTKNARKLSTRLRTMTMLQTFYTLTQVDSSLRGALNDMSPDALGRTYGAALSAFGALAGQFEEQEEVDNEDSADAAKEYMLERLDNISKREMQIDAESQTG